jgi:hypothetical protein
LDAEGLTTLKRHPAAEPKGEALQFLHPRFSMCLGLSTQQEAAVPAFGAIVVAATDTASGCMYFVDA